MHIGIVHRCEHFRKIISCDCNSIFRIDILGCDHFCDGIVIILILYHHHMNFKDCRIRFTDFTESLFVDFLKLCNRCCLGFLKPFQFDLGILNLFPSDLHILPLEDRNFSNSDCTIYSLTLIF